MNEAPKSVSWIDYKEKTKTVKVGDKILQNGGKQGKGVVSLQSHFGSAELTFE